MNQELCASDEHAKEGVSGTARFCTAGVREDLLMAMDTIPRSLDMAFRTALLLTDDMKTAEEAVMQGIGACEDLSPRGLVIETSRSAVQRRTKSSVSPCEIEHLPPELRRLFILQPLLRHCFVLRILVGLTPEVCAELLEISVTEFEGALHAALIQLPLYRCPKV